MMRLLFCIGLGFCMLSVPRTVFGQGNCTGTGTYDDPYIYTSVVHPITGDQFIIKRGQTITSEENEFESDGVEYRDSETRYAQVDERIDKREVPKLGISITLEHVGSSTDLKDFSVHKKQLGQWKRIFHKVSEVAGWIVKFQDPLNAPPAIVGVPVVRTIMSEMHQDVFGDSGSLDVTCEITKANPNPNNDPLAEDLMFHFEFDLSADSWSALVVRQVNGNYDMLGNDAGGWSPYGGGTGINLPNPTQPLSGAQTDWYIDGTAADDAWTLMHIVHHHPGPLHFGFQPMQQAYVEQYAP